MRIVIELRHQYALAGLLKAAGLARNTFYQQQKTLQVRDKYADLKARIRAIYDQHKGRYGYRRITVALRQQSKLINHKTVQRLMDQLQLKSLVRLKKYRVFRGLMRRIEPNILAKDIEAGQPNEKWITDVTEINIESEKLYHSPVADLFNGQIIAYKTAKRPLSNMVKMMLTSAFKRLGSCDKPILHSDQGWQY